MTNWLLCTYIYPKKTFWNWSSSFIGTCSAVHILFLRPGTGTLCQEIVTYFLFSRSAFNSTSNSPIHIAEIIFWWCDQATTYFPPTTFYPPPPSRPLTLGITFTCCSTSQLKRDPISSPQLLRQTVGHGVGHRRYHTSTMTSARSHSETNAKTTSVWGTKGISTTCTQRLGLCNKGSAERFLRCSCLGSHGRPGPASSLKSLHVPSHGRTWAAERSWKLPLNTLQHTRRSTFFLYRFVVSLFAGFKMVFGLIHTNWSLRLFIYFHYIHA